MIAEIQVAAVMTNKSFEIKILSWPILLEEHKKSCTCSYCHQERENNKVCNISYPIDRTGWYYFYLRTKKSSYYLRYINRKKYNPSIVKKVKRICNKKYSNEELYLLSSFLYESNRSISFANTKWDEMICTFLSEGKVPELNKTRELNNFATNFLPALKTKKDDLPLYIADPNPIIRSAVKWRLHIGK